MQFERTSLPEVILCKPDVFRDERGYFMECFHVEKYRQGGIDCEFVQDNRSLSGRNVLRGLHFQRRKPQAKLVSCLHGKILDVAVDIRSGSPSFGSWVGKILSEENAHQMFIPVGFAHGFCVLSESAEIMYKCSGFYDASDDRGLMWNDPDVGIEWMCSSPVLSDKDKQQPLLAELIAINGLPGY
ncbi:MAG: dTDP-4-dehydrorhamnose 3,5-epimerase [Kiritimatiellae bacterium]|jgi:dTDP-4-dehydrorhamnose 3,5-epimerase|nr:dTDP-4-dehydrorhamnose 3,5-epimerase [Kiritimatiellia bacterium]